jgi:hypothetical protein
MWGSNLQDISRIPHGPVSPFPELLGPQLFYLQSDSALHDPLSGGMVIRLLIIDKIHDSVKHCWVMVMTVCRYISILCPTTSKWKMVLLDRVLENWAISFHRHDSKHIDFFIKWGLQDHLWIRRHFRIVGFLLNRIRKKYEQEYYGFLTSSSY